MRNLTRWNSSLTMMTGQNPNAGKDSNHAGLFRTMKDELASSVTPAGDEQDRLTARPPCFEIFRNDIGNSVSEWTRREGPRAYAIKGALETKRQDLSGDSADRSGELPPNRQLDRLTVLTNACWFRKDNPGQRGRSTLHPPLRYQFSLRHSVVRPPGCLLHNSPRSVSA